MLSVMTAGFLALAATVCASPLNPRVVACAAERDRDATFDDINDVTGLPYNQIPIPYEGLKYQGFRLVSVMQTNLLPGTLPHSGKKIAVSDPVLTTFTGSAEWTVNYQDSIYTAFSPESFYYGCNIDLKNGLTALPTDCDITITGFKKGDNTNDQDQVVTQLFSYNPSTGLGPQELALGTFNSKFKDVQYVLIKYTLPGGKALLSGNLVLVVDDVKYSTCV